MINFPKIPKRDQKMVIEGSLRPWEARIVRVMCAVAPWSRCAVEVVGCLDTQEPSLLYRDPERGKVVNRLADVRAHYPPDVYIGLGTRWLKHWRETRPLPRQVQED